MAVWSITLLPHLRSHLICLPWLPDHSKPILTRLTMAEFLWASIAESSLSCFCINYHWSTYIHLSQITGQVSRQGRALLSHQTRLWLLWSISLFVLLVDDDLTRLFVEEFFQCKYPFSKYDQLFCPEFNQGAMENVGAVTFTEQYIFKDKPTVAARVGRADTILHEMAHMYEPPQAWKTMKIIVLFFFFEFFRWFGNLVSPVWWNGLWLNESFATYMAALAVAESTSFGALSWQEFLRYGNDSSLEFWC